MPNEEKNMPEIPPAEIDSASWPGNKFKTLDPPDWDSFRTQARRMLDDILDYTKNIRERPVWQPIPDQVRARFHDAVPTRPSSLAEIHKQFMEYILPFAVGNVHPGFMGWVHGGGTPVGTLAEMLAAGLNANLGGRDQVPVEVERQITRWMQQAFGFPEGATGLFVTGTSMANLIAIVVARDASLGHNVRGQGVAAKAKRLTAYASTAVHGCIGKAMDLCGLGSDALRVVPTGERRRIDLAALEQAIREDRETGLEPFLIVGTAGTVDTGAIDDLTGLANLACREKLWFHVDGAYGALAVFAPDLASKLAGIERADSLAFDFHKWGQVPYDAGFVLVRDGALHQSAFAASSAYLKRETRGLAAGSPWPCDYGPDLSRGFRALKTWFTLKVYGTEAIGAAISQTCALARYLERRIAETPELELLAPVELNVVCFRYRADDPDRVNARIVVELQESGVVAPSTTTIDGHFAVRAAVVNHRTGPREIDTLVDRTLALGRKSKNGGAPGGSAPKTIGTQAPNWEQWDAELRESERRLLSDPNSADLRFRRALSLSQLGHPMDSAKAYLEVLKCEPAHLGALNNLGGVLMGMGNRKAALTAFREAVARHPDDPMSHVNMGNLLFAESEQSTIHGKDAEAAQMRQEARENFEQALRVSPDYERAHEGLFYLFRDAGDKQSAAWHQRKAFRNRYIIPMPYCGQDAPVTVLKLVSTAGGNVKLQSFLAAQIFQTFVVVPEFYNPNTPLPPHQLVINAIGDAELSSQALDATRAVLARTTAPLINPPAAVLATTRSNNAKRLAGLPGVVTPITITLSRDRLSAPDAPTTLSGHGIDFPLLLRTPGFHTGLYFRRAETIQELRAVLAELPGEEFIVMQFLDASGTDGKTRKYRAMMIDGQLYPLHLAISNQWKIHYFTADMAENPQNRAEDAAFLDDMPRAIGPVAMQALEQIQSVLGLDYAGIDFGLNANGEVLVFEANATMVVNPPPPGEQWDYRRPAYKRIYAAVQDMLLRKAGRRVCDPSPSDAGVLCQGIPDRGLGGVSLADRA